MAEQEKWKWQEPGMAWKGVGLYHVTLTVTDRQPLLGTLATPDNDPMKARVNRTALGNALVDCLLSIPTHHPEVQVLHFCLMPDHLHAVLYVRRTMPTGIGTLVRGFWQAAKKLGRAHTAALSSSLTSPSSFPSNAIRENPQGVPPTLRDETTHLESASAALRQTMGDEAYYRLAPVFTEMPFIRPMSHNTQLPNTIRYIDMNPQRLATKRMKPGFFREQRPFIVLADNGFRDFYKPIDSLFDACAAGRVLILSPWPYDANKRHISRMECVALNEMAEEICHALTKKIIAQEFS